MQRYDGICWTQVPCNVDEMISISTYMLWFYELYFVFVIDRNLLKCSSNPSNFKSCKIWTSMNCQYYSIIDWVWRQRMICCPWRQKYCQSPKSEGNISVRGSNKSYVTLIPLNNCIIVEHFTTDTWVTSQPGNFRFIKIERI